MLKPKLRIGDKVKTHRGIFRIIEMKKQEAIATHAIKIRPDGSILVSPTTISEHWTYRLDDGHIWRFAEDILIPLCPHCESEGWDWVSGCGECGLSP